MDEEPSGRCSSAGFQKVACVRLNSPIDQNCYYIFSPRKFFLSVCSICWFRIREICYSSQTLQSFSRSIVSKLKEGMIDQRLFAIFLVALQMHEHQLLAVARIAASGCAVPGSFVQ